jgi:hypothetical protein
MQNDNSQPAGGGRRFSWRALTSVLIAISFLVLVFSGVILFVSPPGRVANWTNWTILGLRKQEWAGLHIGFSTLFLLVAVFHLVFNWRPFVGYFKDRLSRRMGFRWEWLVAAVISGAAFAGLRAGLPPFSSLLALNEQVKNRWERPRERAPIPHAELLTLAELARQAGVELSTATNRLATRGMVGASADSVVQELADQNQRSAQQIYDAILESPAQRAPGHTGDPGRGGGGGGAGGGPGRKTLAQFCADESIVLEDALGRLQAGGIKAAPEQTLREIAVNNGYDRPYEILDVIRGGK